MALQGWDAHVATRDQRKDLDMTGIDMSSAMLGSWVPVKTQAAIEESLKGLEDNMEVGMSVPTTTFYPSEQAPGATYAEPVTGPGSPRSRTGGLVARTATMWGSTSWGPLSGEMGDSARAGMLGLASRGDSFEDADGIPQRLDEAMPGSPIMGYADLPSDEVHLFPIGVHVLYWSDTHKQWMDATVTRQNFDPRGSLLTYDLDVKRGAQAGKIRRLPPAGEPWPQPPNAQAPSKTLAPTPMGHSIAAAPAGAARAIEIAAAGGGGENPQQPPVAGTVVPPGPPPQAINKEDQRLLPRFEEGERVAYWSDTYLQWMQARVERIRDDGVTYDLDVKRGAQRRKMKALPWADNQSAVMGSDPRMQAAQTDPRAQTRGPSPLSGRARGISVEPADRGDRDVSLAPPPVDLGAARAVGDAGGYPRIGSQILVGNESQLQTESYTGMQGYQGLEGSGLPTAATVVNRPRTQQNSLVPASNKPKSDLGRPSYNGTLETGPAVHGVISKSETSREANEAKRLQTEVGMSLEARRIQDASETRSNIESRRVQDGSAEARRMQEAADARNAEARRLQAQAEAAEARNAEVRRLQAQAEAAEPRSNAEAQGRSTEGGRRLTTETGSTVSSMRVSTVGSTPQASRTVVGSLGPIGTSPANSTGVAGQGPMRVVTELPTSAAVTAYPGTQMSTSGSAQAGAGEPAGASSPKRVQQKSAVPNGHVAATVERIEHVVVRQEEAKPMGAVPAAMAIRGSGPSGSPTTSIAPGGSPSNPAAVPALPRSKRQDVKAEDARPDESRSVAPVNRGRGLERRTPQELAALAHHLGVDRGPATVANLSAVPTPGAADGELAGRVAAALARMPLREIRRQLSEAHVDTSLVKEKQDLEALLAETLIRQPQSTASAGGRTVTGSIAGSGVATALTSPYSGTVVAGGPTSSTGPAASAAPTANVQPTASSGPAQGAASGGASGVVVTKTTVTKTIRSGPSPSPSPSPGPTPSAMPAPTQPVAAPSALLAGQGQAATGTTVTYTQAPNASTVARPGQAAAAAPALLAGPGQAPSAVPPVQSQPQQVAAPGPPVGPTASSGAGGQGVASGGIKVSELEIGAGAFNPCAPQVRGQLLAKMGCSERTTIEEMTGFKGGLNEGVWFLSDLGAPEPRPKEFVLKLVRCHRISQSVPTEAENFIKMASAHPGIVNDPCVAFPAWIFSCLGPDRGKRYDLIVMWKARGERLAELIATKWYGKQIEALWNIFSKLGENLGGFHKRYGNNQHGDYQPSNIFYDESSQMISLIDVGGMGILTMENDKEHFAKALKILTDAYGPQLLSQGYVAFEAGYARGAR